jgi:hypothetical protein
MPQQGKNIFTKIAPRMQLSTLSHLSIMILVIAFDFFWLWIALRVSLDVFLKMDRFLICGGWDISTSVVSSSLQLKQHLAC